MGLHFLCLNNRLAFDLSLVTSETAAVALAPTRTGFWLGEGLLKDIDSIEEGLVRSINKQCREVKERQK